MYWYVWECVQGHAGVHTVFARTNAPTPSLYQHPIPVRHEDKKSAVKDALLRAAHAADGTAPVQVNIQGKG